MTYFQGSSSINSCVFTIDNQFVEDMQIRRIITKDTSSVIINSITI